MMHSPLRGSSAATELRTGEDHAESSTSPASQSSPTRAAEFYGSTGVANAERISAAFGECGTDREGDTDVETLMFDFGPEPRGYDSSSGQDDPGPKDTHRSSVVGSRFSILGRRVQRADDVKAKDSEAPTRASTSKRRLPVDQSAHSSRSTSSAHFSWSTPSRRTSQRSSTVGATVSKSSASPESSQGSPRVGVSARLQMSVSRCAPPNFVEGLCAPVAPPFPRPQGTFRHQHRSYSASHGNRRANRRFLDE